MPTSHPLRVLALGPWPMLERLSRCFGTVPVAVSHQRVVAWPHHYCLPATDHELILLDGTGGDLAGADVPAGSALRVWIGNPRSGPLDGVDHVVDPAAMETMLPILAQLSAHRAHAQRLARERIALIDANPDAVVVVDATGHVRFVNAAAMELFGRAEAELLDQQLGFSVGDGIVTEIDIHQGGRLRRVEMRIATVNWEGRPATLAILRDVTEQRLVDERLRQAQKLEVIGRLAAGIAHDFNNVLQGVIGNLEIVTEEVAPGSLVKDCVDIALNAALRGVDLSTRLLTLSRQQVTWARPIDVRPLLREVRAMMVRIAAGRPRIEIDVSPDVGTVMVDPTQLETALLNLLGNAADAQPVDATIRVEARRRHGAPARDGPARDGPAPDGPAPDGPAPDGPAADGPVGHYVVLSVSDEGMGMDEETVRHAFDPFFTTKGVRGTGLGLPIVKEFAEAAGGGLLLHSEPGKGTRVELWLPTTAPSPC